MLSDLRRREDLQGSDLVQKKRLQRSVWLQLISCCCPAASTGLNASTGCRGCTLQLAPKLFKGLAKCGGANWLALDTLDQRYLLVATHLAVAAYDTAASSSTTKPASNSHAPASEHSPMFKLDRAHAGFHKYVTNCAIWYPVDTGLFVSASHDNTVKVCCK